MSLLGNKEHIERFHREAHVVSRLQHENIVRLLDYDVDTSGAPYLVMELLAGETLAERIARSGAIEARTTARIVAEVARGLGAAHDQGVVHRDIKPENVFLTRGARGQEGVKLLDFGLSRELTGGGKRITAANTVMGSPYYMAPEVLLDRSEEIGAHTDQYALGAVAFEMLAGRPPFIGSSFWQISSSALEQPAPSLAAFGVSSEVNAVVQRSLAKRPQERFPDVAELAAELARAAGTSSLMPPADAEMFASRSAESGVRPMPNTSEEAAGALADAMRAFAAGRPSEARDHAERAYGLLEQTSDPSARALLSVSADLIERFYLARLGGAEASLEVQRVPKAGDKSLSPQLAYLVSRLDGRLTVAEVIDLSPLPRLETVRALTRLLSDGFIRVATS